MEDAHVLLLSVRDKTIEPDDLIRNMLQGQLEWEFMPTVQSLEQYMLDYYKETGEFPDHDGLVEFSLCGGCNKLRVWDREVKAYIHIVENDCKYCRDDHYRLLRVRA